MIDLPSLAAQLNEYGILQKSFMDMSKSEILLLITAVFSCPSGEVPAEGWGNPTIDDSGSVLIPFNAHPKYRWWTADGQSILQTLFDLNAPWVVAKKYLDSRGNTSMTEEAYMQRLIPF